MAAPPPRRRPRGGPPNPARPPARPPAKAALLLAHLTEMRRLRLKRGHFEDAAERVMETGETPNRSTGARTPGRARRHAAARVAVLHSWLRACRVRASRVLYTCLHGRVRLCVAYSARLAAVHQVVWHVPPPLRSPPRWLVLLARELTQLGIEIPTVEVRYR